MATPEPPQRDSFEAPSPTHSGAAIRLSLSDEVRAGLSAEVSRLEQVSVIGKLVGGRPSRGELRDLLQSRLLAEVGKIVDIQILGRGFYQVEFETGEAATRVVSLSPLALGSARVHFRAWAHDFDPASDAASSFIPAGDRGFPVTACFPGLRREYLPLLPQIGRALGTVLEAPPTLASVVARAAGLPSVCIIIPDPAKLPPEILLPTLSGGWITQRVEFSGLPNQCFACRKVGHLAKACPTRSQRTRQRRPSSTRAPGPPGPPPPASTAGASPRPGRGSSSAVPGGSSAPAPEDPGTEKWQRVAKGKGVIPREAPSMEWVPTGNRFTPLREEGESSQVGDLTAGVLSPGGVCASPPPDGVRPASPRVSQASRRSLLASFSQSRREQPSSSSSRPAVVVRASPLGAIAPQLVSFDYNVQGESFGYEFTRHFGDSEDSRPPSPIRVHVALLRARGPSSLGSAVAFSFPLCGYAQEDWTVGEASRFLSSQVVEFSNHLEDLEVTDLLGMFWGVAKFSFLAGSGTGERHLLVHLIADSRAAPCYVFVHEDGRDAFEVLTVATGMWREVCCALSERLVTTSGRRDWDYSPSKPASKIARMAARAAALLSSSSP